MVAVHHFNLYTRKLKRSLWTVLSLVWEVGIPEGVSGWSLEGEEEEDIIHPASSLDVDMDRLH